MKIKVNEKEFYNIDIPEEITSGDELLGLAERFKSISIIFKKNIPSLKDRDNLPEHKKSREGKLYGDKYYSFFKNINKDRSKAVMLLQFYYNDSKENKKILANKLEIKWDVIQARLWGVKNAHDITYSEVGLIRFPTRHETKAVGELKNPSFFYNKDILNELLLLCEGVKE